MKNPVLRILLEGKSVLPEEVASLDPADVNAGLKEWLDIVEETKPEDDEHIVVGGRNLSHAPGQLSTVVLGWYRESAGPQRALVAARFFQGLWFGPTRPDETAVRVFDDCLASARA